MGNIRRVEQDLLLVLADHVAQRSAKRTGTRQVIRPATSTTFTSPT
jgi:hypothetical protein